MVFIFAEIYFSFYNGFSGQKLFADMLPLCYNSLWTSWPCIFNYAMEKDVDEYTSLTHPKLYLAGHKNYYLNMKRFWKWIIFAMLHGIILFYGITYSLNCSIGSDGHYNDNWYISTIAFSCMITVVILKMYVDQLYWNLFSL